MSTIIVSQTLVLNGSKMEQCKHLRVCTKVNSKGVAIANAWRDAKDDLPIADAVKQLEELGYKPSQDFVRTTILGKGRAHRTRIVRMIKVAETAQEAETQVTEQAAPILTPEAQKAKKPHKGKRSKNAEQVSEQLHNEAVQYLAEDGFTPEAIEQMMDIIEAPLN